MYLRQFLYRSPFGERGDLRVFFNFVMGTRRFLSLRELEAILEDPAFFEDDDNDSSPIDIVELPPDSVDNVSDEENIDDNVLEDTYSTDVPGAVELHSSCLRPINDDDPTHLLQCSEATASKSTFEGSSRNSIKVSRKKRKKRQLPENEIVTAENITPRSDEKKQNPKRNQAQKSEKIVSQWIKDETVFSDHNAGADDDAFSEKKQQVCNAFRGKSPVEVFETLFDEEIMEYIVRQSVIFASQNNYHDFTFSIGCLKKFLAVLILSGYHSLPQEKMYWSEDEDLNIQSVRKCITKNRYLEIKKCLHFNDNSNIPDKREDRDKLFKIRPLVDKFNQKFVMFGVFSKNISIDEQMIRYFGHHYLKQFIRGKPIRFGFKQWAMCCGETGYCFHASIYEGKEKNEPLCTGLGASVVLNKLSVTENASDHHFYFDNFFTSFTLLKMLKDKEVCATGTCRYNRMNNCPIKNDNEIKKQERGIYDHRYDKQNNIFAITWNDNNSVKLMSTHQGLYPLGFVKRWSKAAQKDIQISQPYLIAQYNKFMGGVDKLDWLIQKYRTKIRGKKWYFPIFTNLLDCAIVNAYILYCMSNDNMPLLQFRRYICRVYLNVNSILSNPKKAGRPSFNKLASKRVLENIRRDGNGHIIERTENGKQRKCAVCKSNARKQCRKCNVGLHLDCMELWHSA